MDKRNYSVLGVQLLNDKTVDLHLSKRTYSLDLSNRKGLTNYTILETEPMTAKALLEKALETDSIVELGLPVVFAINSRLEKIKAEEDRITAGPAKRGRKPKAPVVPAVVVEELTDAALQDIVDSLIPEVEDAV